MKKIFLLILLTFLSGSVFAQSVGVAPGYKSLGEIKRGETIEVSGYIMGSADNNFYVRPGFSQPLRSEIFSSTAIPGGEVSEENINSWIDFTKEKYLVTPKNSTLVGLKGGTLVSSNGEFSFRISVPMDAEPGYHFGRVKLNPISSENVWSTYGASVRTISPFVFVFRVPGDVEREIRVVEVNAYRVEDNLVRLEKKIKNTGTVTVSSESSRYMIENYVGEKLSEMEGTAPKLKPGESLWVTDYWKEEDLQGGEYKLKGSINYMTGRSFISESFKISDEVNITDSTSSNVQNQGERESLPYWLVIMVLIVLGVLMYVFEIDPFWILVIIGLSAAALLILLSGISNYLLIALITTAGLIIYYGWL